MCCHQRLFGYVGQWSSRQHWKRNYNQVRLETCVVNVPKGKLALIYLLLSYPMKCARTVLRELVEVAETGARSHRGRQKIEDRQLVSQ